MRVAVLMGGRSSEREISLRTGRGIAEALRNLGHEVVAIDAADGRRLPPGDEERQALAAVLDPSDEVALARPETLRDAEVVLIALHGSSGENGTLQALLDLAGKPYSGSGMLASALAMNKAVSKRIFEQAGIPTPAWQLVSADAPAIAVDASALGGYPLVVKPNEEGSSVGLTVVRGEGELPGALRLAAEFGAETLVERYIEGRELTVALLGDRPLPIVEIRPRSGLYDYESKYTVGHSEYSCPADLPEPLAGRVRELGRAAASVLGCSGVSRVDFRLDQAEIAYCLEVNTVPGMTPTSLVPMAARAAGISYDQVVQHMIDLALADARRRRIQQPSKT